MKTVKLGDVCEFKPAKSAVKDRYGNGTMVSFSPMEQLPIAQKYFTPKQIKKLSEVYSSYVYFEDNDVIYAKITPCFENGKMSIAKNLKSGVGFGSSEFVPIRCSDQILPEYLYYFLLKPSFIEHGSQNMRGASGHKRVPDDFTKELRLVLPDVEEQRRVVERLDAAFEKIDRAIELTEKNVKKSQELFDHSLQDIIANNHPTWDKKTLREISREFGRGKSKHRPRNDKKLYNGKYPFIQTGDIRNSGHYITKYAQTYNDFGLTQSKLWPKGTICITIAANIAETGILSFAACFPDSVIGLVVDESQADGDYVEYVLQSLKTRLQSLGKGSAQDNINLGTFENELFPFPKLSIQKQIVDKLNMLSNDALTLRAKYKTKIAYLKSLKQSLLTQAFTQSEVE